MGLICRRVGQSLEKRLLTALCASRFLTIGMEEFSFTARIIRYLTPFRKSVEKIQVFFLKNVTGMTVFYMKTYVRLPR